MSTDKATENHDAAPPLGLGLSEGLGLNLPEQEDMDMPKMPPTPRPALVLNLSLPMAKGGKIIPQPLWMESQLKDYAQQHALQFERAAASLALERADLAAKVATLRSALCAMLDDDDHDAAKSAARAALVGLGA